MPGRPNTFRPHGAPTVAHLAQASDKRRGSARDRGYNASWDRSSVAYRFSHPLCLGCSAADLTTPTAVCDHIEPHEGDRIKFWDEDNWQPACGWHHDVVKQKLEVQWRAGALPVEALRLDSPQSVMLTRELLDAGARPY